MRHFFGLADYIFLGTKGFPFLGEELCAILIKSVLVFSGLVPKNVFAGSKDGRLEQTSVLFDVIRVFLLEAFHERS